MTRVGAIEAFDHTPGPLVVCGVGSLARLGELATRVGGSPAFIVTDAGVRAAGILDRALHSLEAAGIETRTHDAVPSNPSSTDVAAAAEVARDGGGAGLLIGLGGGSAMDCAKGVNFLLTNGGSMEDYWGYGKAGGPMLPSIGVPTTAGTGSESQSYALISDPVTRRKMACGDIHARFRAVLLDAALTTTMPADVTGATGIDAIAHSVESYVCTKANPMSRMYAREAFALLSSAFEQALERPDDIDARAAMLLGAHYAGSAIENSMLGAAHAAANPLTASHGVAHGAAVALMLPHVVAYNADANPRAYDGFDPRAGHHLVADIESMRAAARLPSRLRDEGIQDTDIPALSAMAAEEWTGKYNPRPVDRDAFAALYGAAL